MSHQYSGRPSSSLCRVVVSEGNGDFVMCNRPEEDLCHSRSNQVFYDIEKAPNVKKECKPDLDDQFDLWLGGM
jgi:hypothetical protein